MRAVDPDRVLSLAQIPPVLVQLCGTSSAVAEGAER
jgi:hypothetical protein